MLIIPEPFLRLHGIGIGKAFGMGMLVAHDAPQVRAHLVGAALFEAVAGRAGLDQLLTGGRIGGGQKRRHRIGLCRSGGLGGGGLGLLHFHLIGPFGREVRVNQLLGDEPRQEGDQRRHQDRHENLIEGAARHQS